MLFVNCGSRPNTSKNTSTMPFAFEFDLTKPSQTYELPPILKEISALGFNKKNELGCLQDEDGFIFFYDLNKAKIADRVLFRKSGDYEGIEFVNDLVYVLKSDGSIFEIKNLGLSTQTITAFKTLLNKKNDTEGLCYDKKNHCLLIACKENAGLNGEVIKNQKSVFAFDLNTKKLIKKPFLNITDDAIFDFIEKHDLQDFSFNSSESVQFKPSGIAVKNGFYYIIASVGNMIIVVDENSEIQYISSLNKNQLPKPEGITFDKNGKLYLSSEGDKGNGIIQVF